MPTRYNVLLTWDQEEGVWTACAPTVNWLSTFGDTREEALANVREAILGYMEATAKEGLEMPSGDASSELATVEINPL